MSNQTKAETIKRKVEFWTRRYHSPINEMPDQLIQADCKKLDWIRKARCLRAEIIGVAMMKNYKTKDDEEAVKILDDVLK